MAHPHQKSTHLLKSCAQSFEVALNPLDVDKWSAGFTMAKALDTLVDEDHEYDSGTYAAQLLAGESIPYVTDEEAIFIRTTYDALSYPSKEQWRHSASNLGAFAIKRLEASTIEDYIGVVRDESHLMADVLKVENDEARRDTAQRQVFNAWMDQMGQTAYLCDTLSDFIRDHNEGNMSITPTARGAVMLARHALKELFRFTQVTPLPIYTAMTQRAVTKTLEKVQRPAFFSTQFIKQASAHTSSK